MKEDLAAWLNALNVKLESVFPSRIRFLGLQGSCGRGEDRPDSDIDVVLILDRASAEDVEAYGALLSRLPDGDRVCGFVAGWEEIAAWEKSDLLFLALDVTPLFGSLDPLPRLIGREDLLRAIRIGAGNLYHASGHLLAHERTGDALPALYKAATFSLRATHCLETGDFVRECARLLPRLTGENREILNTYFALRENPSLGEREFSALCGRLFAWSGALLRGGEA